MTGLPILDALIWALVVLAALALIWAFAAVLVTWMMALLFQGAERLELRRRRATSDEDDDQDEDE